MWHHSLFKTYPVHQFICLYLRQLICLSIVVFNSCMIFLVFEGFLMKCVLPNVRPSQDLNYRLFFSSLGKYSSISWNNWVFKHFTYLCSEHLLQLFGLLNIIMVSYRIETFATLCGQQQGSLIGLKRMSKHL